MGSATSLELLAYATSSKYSSGVQQRNVQLVICHGPLPLGPHTSAMLLRQTRHWWRSTNGVLVYAMALLYQWCVKLVVDHLSYVIYNEFPTS
jgi:hypothetical protein